MPRELPDTVTPLLAASPSDGDAKEAELAAMLVRRRVPDKAEILRVKGLVGEIARERFVAHEAEERTKSFISAYFDLYLGLVTADAAIEKAALRRCLDCLSFDAQPLSPQGSGMGPDHGDVAKA